jgi:hypothetical protein
MTQAPTVEDATARGIRRMLLATLLLAAAGLSADLLLLDHVESWTQLIPLGVMALALASLLASLLVSAAAVVHGIRLIMVMAIASGLVGGVLHFRGNAAFQRELAPDIRTSDLFWKSIRAKAPPALAPFAMLQFGLIGLAWSYRHPALRSRPPLP